MRAREAHGLDIDFVFADGVLAYDCVACEAKCCKHGDFYLDRATELEALRGAVPQIAPFLSGFDAPHRLLGTSHHPACWFLDGTERCVLHARGLKPYNCQLYPVNHLHVLGDRCYVDVSLTCPLGLRETEGQAGTLITYDSIHELLLRHPAGSRLASQGVAPGYPRLHQDLGELLLCLHEHAAGWKEGVPWSQSYVALRERAGAPIAADEVEGRLRVLHELFATKAAPAESARLLDASLTALTPTLLFHEQWPRVAAASGREALLEWLTERFDVLLGVRYLCEVGVTLSQRRFGVGSIGSLMQESRAFARTLGLAHRPLALNRDAPLKAPSHLADAARQLRDRLGREERSLLEHLRDMAVDPCDVRTLLELITLNLSRYA